MKKIYSIVLALVVMAMSVNAAPARSKGRAMRAPILHAPQAVGAPMPIPRVLVILVSYTDLAIQSKNNAQAMDSLFNVAGYSYNNATGCVSEYFSAQSNGAYQPVFDVVGPVTLANNRKYYGENSYGDTDRRAGDMIKEACTLVNDQVNYAEYDSNGDGKVDCVYVLYAGIGANDTGGEEDAIWPHQHTISGLTLDGKQISTYACSGEIDGYVVNRTGVGPICHEFGHAIGMPDYYSTGSSSGYIVGEWSVMDYGMYNNNANTPPNYSLFDKEYMGWTTVEELAVDSQATITLTTNYGDGCKFTAGGATYYLENRQQAGWDIGLYGHGMLIWQVKYDQSAWNNNRVNNTVNSPRYTVLTATRGILTNGLSSDEDPFPGSQNVTSWTTYEGFAITEITEANGQITFKLNGGAPVDPTDPTDMSLVNGDWSLVNGRKIMQNGQIVIIRGDKRYNALGIEIQ